MNTRVFFGLLFLTLNGCDDEIDTPREAAQGTAKPNDVDHPDVPPAADNTARNERDADGGTVTPFDQGQSGPDIEITAQIRRAVLEDQALSANADNVKIITSGGMVTLRGPVASEAEKAAVEAKAKAVAGVTDVVNQLEIQPN